jgi:hypothetical protein
MDNKRFLPLYRKNRSAVWIRGKLSNDEEFAFDDTKKWRAYKSYCEDNKLFFTKLYLQFKSHQEEIDLKGVEGVYIGRAIRGQMGSSNNTHYYVVAAVRGKKMYKKWWITPELLVEKEVEDDVTDDAIPAIIYDKTQTHR